MSERLIAVNEIAAIHGKRKQSIHKIVRRLGLQVTKTNTGTSRGQAASHITLHDYEELQRYLPGTTDSGSNSMATGYGWFYIIRLEPKLDPGRFKAGFTANLDERLRSHKTSAPNAEIVRSWPCKLLWEKTAIECIAQDCEQLYTEVFRTDNISSIVDRANRFFTLMPSLERWAK